MHGSPVREQESVQYIGLCWERARVTIGIDREPVPRHLIERDQCWGLVASLDLGVLRMKGRWISLVNGKR